MGSSKFEFGEDPSERTADHDQIVATLDEFFSSLKVDGKIPQYRECSGELSRLSIEYENQSRDGWDAKFKSVIALSRRGSPGGDESTASAQSQRTATPAGRHELAKGSQEIDSMNTESPVELLEASLQLFRDYTPKQINNLSHKFNSTHVTTIVSLRRNNRSKEKAMTPSLCKEIVDTFTRILSTTEQVDKLVRDYKQFKENATVKRLINDLPQNVEMPIQELLEAYREVLDLSQSPGQVVKSLKMNIARVKLYGKYRALCAAPIFLRRQKRLPGRGVESHVIDLLKEELGEPECPIERTRLTRELDAARMPATLAQEFGPGIFAVLQSRDIQR